MFSQLILISKISKHYNEHTLSGIQTSTINKSATARLARNKLVGPFSCFEVKTATIIKVFPESVEAIKDEAINHVN